MENNRKTPTINGLLTSIIIGTAMIAFLAGCATSADKQKNSEETFALSKEKVALEQTGGKSDEGSLVADKSKKSGRPAQFNVQERMAPLSKSRSKGKSKKPKGSYRFQVANMPIKSALALFARTYGLNIVTDLDVIGKITVNIKNLPFERAMEAILDVHGYYWEWKEGLIRVHKHETKALTVDYIRLVRSGSAESQAQISSGGGKGGGGGKRAGDITISQEDEVDFWSDLEAQVRELLSKEGKLVISKLAGVIFVTDFHPNVARVERFINILNQAIYRQVEIQVRIFEVTLNEESSLGMDWTQAVNEGAGASVSSSNVIVNPFGGTLAKKSTAVLSYGVLGGYNFNAMVQFMKEHGDIKIVSQPRVRVLNNQPALIKVGTERPFFQATSTPVAGGGVATVTVTEYVQYVTIGVVLSVTAQISEDRKIMLDVTPIITRLIDSVTSKFGSTAPVMDVKQSSTLVRLNDGEMVVIGGLIQDVETKTERKIPLLGDIPILGYLFKSQYSAKTKRELVVFLTPTIVKDK
ncbi:MAG: pilus (MSHA type) biogenesis protein MshL [bacterium]|nr:MAG: pilus (MSHA type) biogenesis protein MshL [bacterium]